MACAKMSRHVKNLKNMKILHINLHLGHLVMDFFYECGKIGHFGWPDLNFYTSKVAKTTQNTTTTTTHNNQNEPPPPYPLPALPSLSIGRLLAPPTNGATAPYGPTQGVHGRVWQRNGWFTCYGGKMKTHQKIEK
jgi:hypothetical protein